MYKFLKHLYSHISGTTDWFRLFTFLNTLIKYQKPVVQLSKNLSSSLNVAQFVCNRYDCSLLSQWSLIVASQLLSNDLVARNRNVPYVGTIVTGGWCNEPTLALKTIHTSPMYCPNWLNGSKHMLPNIDCQHSIINISFIR